MSQISTLSDESFDEFEDDDGYDELEAEFEESEAHERWQSRSGKLRLFCFNCNRMESHYNSMKHRWYFWVLSGMTLGIIGLYGPFRCRCCGNKRLLKSDRYHPKYIYRGRQAKKAIKRDKRRY